MGKKKLLVVGFRSDLASDFLSKYEDDFEFFGTSSSYSNDDRLKLSYKLDFLNGSEEKIEALSGQFKREKIIFDGVLFYPSIVKTRSVSRISLEDLNLSFSVNVSGQICFLSSLLLNNRLNKGCSIVMVSSLSSSLAIPGNSIYSATKGAIDSFVKCSSLEFARKKIRINSVNPGMCRTAMTSGLAHTNKEALALDEKKYPLGYVEKNNVSSFLNYLLSDDSSSMTGQNYVIDGGRSVV